MNREFVTSVSDVTKLAASIFTGESRLHGDRATYLRSLVAGVQAEVAGKPVLRVAGRPRRPDLDGSVAALERTNEAFYAAVVAALPEGLTAAERQSKTSFARSAAATLRRAIKTGWNPLSVAAGSVTKGQLTAWIVEHREPRAITPAAAEKRVVGLAEKIGELLSALPPEERSRVRAIALEGMGEPPPQRLTNVSVRRHQEVRAVQ